MKNRLKNKKTAAYLSICAVILIWGVAPVFTATGIYRYYSASASTAFCAFVAAIALLCISWKKRKLLNATYLKIGLLTGLVNSLAAVLQKIGLQYTTPTRYAFLENLSCVVVPVLVFFVFGKKPSAMKWIASGLCLLGSFVLSGMNVKGDVGAGELLCAFAGLLYGVNIAVTGAFAKRFYAPLYVMIQMWVETVVALVAAVLLSATKINGVAVEPLRFSWEWGQILTLVAFALVSSVFCWVVRTNAMKHVDASVVAVMMPFSAVVTMTVSVFTGTEQASAELLLGAVMVLAAALLSGLSERTEKAKESVQIKPIEEKSSAV